MPQAQSVDIPTRLPLVVQPDNRDGTNAKDAKLVNCYAEKKADGTYDIFKRGGLSAPIRTKSGAGSGQFNWKGNIYEVFGTTLYKDGTSLGTVDGTGGVYRFEETQGATDYLVLGNGVEAYTYNGTTLAIISDVDFPATFVKGWAYLDSTLYVMDSDGNIWGSDLNVPTAWDPLNKIVAQMDASPGVALAKQLAHVIAFKENSTEVFYDAANATGSPLGRVQSAKIEYGCLSADSVQDLGGILVWLAENSGSISFVKLEKLKAEVVSTKPIERLIEKAITISTETIYSWQHVSEGHSFYVITFKNANLTLAYDLNEGLWSYFLSNGNYMPITASVVTDDLAHYIQGESDGNTFSMGRENTNDNGTKIVADIITPNYDGGVDRRKVLHAMRFTGDQVAGSELSVRVSDDDYQSWSNFRKVNLANKRPFLDKCGTFYRRAFHFRHESNTRMRLSSVDFQLDIGTL